MMATKDMQAEKRRKTTKDSDNSGKLQQPRSNDNHHAITGSLLLQPQPHFLPFHFQVLKSLYLSNSANKASIGVPAASSFQSMDDVVPSQAWVLMEQFLNLRTALLRCKAKARECQTISQQALEFDKSRQQQQPQQRDVLPHGKRKRNNDNEEEQVLTVSLVTKIMQHRAAKVQASFQKRVHQPFAPLLQMTQQRIAKLQDTKQGHAKRLQERQQTMSRAVLNLHPPTATTTTTSVSGVHRHKFAAKRLQQEQAQMQHERSQLVATESKIRLWCMLEQDLKQLFC